jgi:branched-subunit amino acid transport protein
MTNIDLWIAVALAIAATFMWRALGVVLSARVSIDGATFRWVSCVSYAMLAALVARMTVAPLGALETTTLSHRLLAMGCALLFFALCRRSVLAGVIAGTVTFMTLLALG